MHRFPTRFFFKVSKRKSVVASEQKSSFILYFLYLLLITLLLLIQLTLIEALRSKQDFISFYLFMYFFFMIHVHTVEGILLFKRILKWLVLIHTWLRYTEECPLFCWSYAIADTSWSFIQTRCVHGNDYWHNRNVKASAVKAPLLRIIGTNTIPSCSRLLETEQMLNICKPKARAKINYLSVRIDVSLLAQIDNAKR